MRLYLTTALLLASVAAAQAQPANTGTPASQMAARAHANANKVREPANALTSVAPDDASADQPSTTQRIIRGQVSGTSNDPVLHYPYGRYGASLGNVDPGSLANPFVRGAPGTLAPTLPSATTGRTPAFHPGR
jgi:hypothetical protein